MPSTSLFFCALFLCSQKEAKKLIGDAVTQGDIANVVARATGIPVQTMLRSEREKLLQMESE
jgi:ATP-dependent Clp protease ATP-binding subunit ClpB